MRLLSRDAERRGSRADQLEPQPETTDPEPHVTTKRLKEQFEERLAARVRRRRRRES